MRKRLLLLLLLPLLLIGAVGCTTGEESDTIKDATEFRSAIAEPGVVVVDVRTPEEFAAGHLPDAVNIDVEAASFDSAIADLDPSVTYAVYCRSGNRSQVAVDKMRAAGIDDVFHLEGGIVAWQAAGGEVTS